MKILINRLLVLFDPQLARVDRENILIARSLGVSLKWDLHPLVQRKELTLVAIKRLAQKNHSEFDLKHLKIDLNYNN